MVESRQFGNFEMKLAIVSRYISELKQLQLSQIDSRGLINSLGFILSICPFLSN